MDEGVSKQHGPNPVSRFATALAPMACSQLPRGCLVTSVTGVVHARRLVRGGTYEALVRATRRQAFYRCASARSAGSLRGHCTCSCKDLPQRRWAGTLSLAHGIHGRWLPILLHRSRACSFKGYCRKFTAVRENGHHPGKWLQRGDNAANGPAIFLQIFIPVGGGWDGTHESRRRYDTAGSKVLFLTEGQCESADPKGARVGHSR